MILFMFVLSKELSIVECCDLSNGSLDGYTFSFIDVEPLGK